jgi:hypothetical protein
MSCDILEASKLIISLLVKDSWAKIDDTEHNNSAKNKVFFEMFFMENLVFC